MKKRTGFKDPEIESYQSVNKYANSLNIDTNTIVYPKDLINLYKLNRIFRGYPEILIFDNMKHLHPHTYDTLKFNVPIDNVLKMLCEFGSNEIFNDYGFTYDSIINCLIDPNKYLASYDLMDIDVVVFISLRKYSLALNRSHLVLWNEIIKAGTLKCNVKYVFVDLDYQDIWGVTNEDLQMLQFKASK